MTRKPWNYKWDFDSIKAEAEKYTTQREFKKYSCGAYSAARRQKIYKNISNHFVREQMPNGHWDNFENCKKEAKKYKTRLEFNRKNGLAHITASKNGWLDKICGHMKKPTTGNNRFIYVYKDSDTKEIYIGLTDDENEKRRKRDHRKRGPKKLVSLIKRNNYEYKRITGLIPEKEAQKKEKSMIKWYSARKSWTVLNRDPGGSLGGNKHLWGDEKSILKEALKYEKKTDFNVYSSGAYSASKKLGIFEEVTKHMDVFSKPRGHWSDEMVRAEALKYGSKVEFKEASPRAYLLARKMDCFEELCKHMKRPRRNKIWDEKTVRETANKYKILNDFRKNERSCRRIAHKLGIYKEITGHMLRQAR